MKLTQRAARTYQYSVMFFAIVSLMLFNHPTILLAPLFIILTLTIYILKGVQKLKKLKEGSFEVSMSITPNISSINDKLRIRIYFESKLDDKLKIEVHVPLSEGLRIDSGESSWIGTLSKRESIILEFTVKIEKAGLHEIGPIQIVAKDDLELVCRDIDSTISGIIYCFEEPVRARGIITSQVTVGFNYPGYTLHPFIGVNEEYRESIKSDSLSLRSIDWKRTARTEGEEVYIKEYSRRRASDLIFGFGTGLDLDIPSFGNVLNWITQISISHALHYLREGSRVWILNYNNGKPVFTQLKLSYGELVSRKDSIPSGGLLIYISRLVDSEELNFLRKYFENNKRFKFNLLLVDLSDVGSRIIDERVINHECERLRNVVSRFHGPVEIVKLRDFSSSLKRSLAFR